MDDPRTIGELLDLWYSEGEIELLAPREIAVLGKLGFKCKEVGNYLFIYVKHAEIPTINLETPLTSIDRAQQSMEYQQHVNPEAIDLYHDVYRKQAIKGVKGFQAKKQPKTERIRVTKEEKQVLLQQRLMSNSISFFNLSQETLDKIKPFLDGDIIFLEEFMIALPSLSGDEILSLFVDLVLEKILDDPNYLLKKGILKDRSTF